MEIVLLTVTIMLLSSVLVSLTSIAIAASPLKATSWMRISRHSNSQETSGSTLPRELNAGNVPAAEQFESGDHASGKVAAGVLD
jgi:hypothetical protein